MEYKLTSMKKQMIRYLYELIIGFIVISVVWLIATYILVVSGIVIPANYNEHILEQNISKIKNAKKVSAKMLPEGASFGVISSDGMFYGTMTEEEARYSKSLLEEKKHRIKGNCVYCMIERDDEICIVKYNMKAKFCTRYDKYLPSYDVASVSLMVISYLIYIYVITSRLIKKWSEEFKKLNYIINEIENQNLDFNSQNSEIEEFNKIFNALFQMRDALSNALLKQWKMESEKNEQIAALAHDIKIPLTIIEGNAELLEDEREGNHYYIQKIMEGGKEIESYIDMLIRFTRTEVFIMDSCCFLQCNEYSNELLKEAILYGKNKGVKIVCQADKIKGKLKLNVPFIQRAFINIIDNAIEHGREGTEIKVVIKRKENKYVVVISNEEMVCKYRKERGEGKKHYGIGFRYAKKMIKMHGGSIQCIQNGTTWESVEVCLPIFD